MKNKNTLISLLVAICFLLTASNVYSQTEKSVVQLQDWQYEWRTNVENMTWLNYPHWRTGFQPGLVKQKKYWGVIKNKSNIKYNSLWKKEPVYNTINLVTSYNERSTKPPVLAYLSNDTETVAINSDGSIRALDITTSVPKKYALKKIKNKIIKTKINGPVLELAYDTQGNFTTITIGQLFTNLAPKTNWTVTKKKNSWYITLNTEKLSLGDNTIKPPVWRVKSKITPNNETAKEFEKAQVQFNE